MTDAERIPAAQALDSLSKTKGKSVVHILLIIYGLVLVYIVGALIFNYQPPVEAFFGLSFVLLFFAIGQCLYEIGIKRTLLFFAITAIIGFRVEILGTNTGFLFGKYTYGDYLGEKVLGVPLVVPLVWFVIVFIAFSLSSYTIDSRTTKSKVVPIIILAAFGTVAWDVLIDPLFTSYGYWTWEISPSTPQLSGVPLTNFVGWLVVSFGMLGIIVLAMKRYARSESATKLIQRPNTMDSQIAYFLLLIDGSVANESRGHSLVVVIGFVAMCAFLFATVWLGRSQRRGRLDSQMSTENKTAQ